MLMTYLGSVDGVAVGLPVLGALLAAPRRATSPVLNEADCRLVVVDLALASEGLNPQTVKHSGDSVDVAGSGAHSAGLPARRACHTTRGSVLLAPAMPLMRMPIMFAAIP